MKDEQFDQGLAMRKRVMGDAFVDSAFANLDAFTRQLQELIDDFRSVYEVLRAMGCVDNAGQGLK